LTKVAIVNVCFRVALVKEEKWGWQGAVREKKKEKKKKAQRQVHHLLYWH